VSWNLENPNASWSHGLEPRAEDELELDSGATSGSHELKLEPQAQAGATGWSHELELDPRGFGLELKPRGPGASRRIRSECRAGTTGLVDNKWDVKVSVL